MAISDPSSFEPNFEMCPGENTHLGLHFDHIVLNLKETNNVECSILKCVQEKTLI